MLLSNIEPDMTDIHDDAGISQMADATTPALMMNTTV